MFLWPVWPGNHSVACPQVSKHHNEMYCGRDHHKVVLIGVLYF